MEIILYVFQPTSVSVLTKLEFITGLIVVASLGACSSIDLKTLAPPGIIKYEQIADEKPANPAIVEEIENYKATEERTFPNLAEEPVAGHSLGQAREMRDDMIRDELIAARDALEGDLDEVQNYRAEDESEIDKLLSRRDALEGAVAVDAKRAKKDKN